MQDVIVIYGPTAVGKSAVAVELAKMMGGEIISADSMQIYKHLDVGTAKITDDEMKGIKHYLLDIKEPSEQYSVAEFCADAQKSIDAIIKNKHTPIIVGGTGLYIKSLISSYNFGNADKNEEFRHSLENLTNEQLYEKLISVTPEIDIDKNNRRRLIRALEISTFGKDKECEIDCKYNYVLFAIIDDREKIYQRINKRVDLMAQNGLLEEAKFVFENCAPNSQAALAIGYKEIFPYLKGESSLEECLNLLKQKSRNYAKRQITFLNQFENINIMNFQGVEQTAKLIKQKYEEIK